MKKGDEEKWKILTLRSGWAEGDVRLEKEGPCFNGSCNERVGESAVARGTRRKKKGGSPVTGAVLLPRRGRNNDMARLVVNKVEMPEKNQGECPKT